MPKLAKAEKLFHIKTPKSKIKFTSLAQIDRVRNMMLGLPIPVAARNKAMRPPLGYKYSKHNPLMLEPVEEHFRYILRAKLYLKQSSYAEVAAWLSEKIRDKVTPMALFLIIRDRCPLDEIMLPIEKRMELVAMNHAFNDRKKDKTEKELLKELES